MLSTVIDAVVNFAIKYGLYFLIPVALGVLGVSISVIFPSDILTSFFVLVRRLLMLFDFAFDVPLILKLFGYSLSIAVAYASYKAFMTIYKIFKNN
jgi:hypothetical protein